MSDAARLAAVVTGFLLVALVPVALAAPSTSGLRSQAASLRATDQSLEARAKAATLELYAIEAELRQARGAVESIAARKAVVARDRTVARKQLAIARKAVHVSETQLALKGQYDEYLWLAAYQPVRRIGKSIRLYRIP